MRDLHTLHYPILHYDQIYLLSGSNQCRVSFIHYKFYHQFQATGYSMQRLADYRENSSPLQDKHNLRNGVKPSLSDHHPPSHSNGHYPRTRFEIQELQPKPNDRPYSAKGPLGTLDNLYQNMINQERQPSYSIKYKRELRDHTTSEQTAFGGGDHHKRSNMNDFSFQDQFGHHTSQASHNNGRRENAWMKGLEAKMNNIESLNDKINSLLSMVKKDRSRERLDTTNEQPFNKKSMDIIRSRSKTNQGRPNPHSIHQRQEENMYQNLQFIENDRKSIGGGHLELSHQSPFKTKPLSIRQQNIEINQSSSNVNYPQKNQRKTSEFFDKETQVQNKDISYSPLSRNKRKMTKNGDINYEESNFSINDTYQPVSPSLRKERQPSNVQSHQKSIDEMLNERRMQRNIKQTEKVDKYSIDLTPSKQSTRSNKNTPKHQKQTPRSVMNEDEGTNNISTRPSLTPTSTQLTQIRQRIAKLTNPTKSQQSALLEDKATTQTGRIYKKNEAATPTRGSYANKRALQIEVPDF